MLMTAKQYLFNASSPRFCGGVKKLSTLILLLEKRTLQILVLLITTIFIANVPLQALRLPIFWATEVSVHLMAMLGAIGASYLIGVGAHPSVTLIEDLVSKATASIMSVIVNICIVIFGASILAISFYWFDPIGVLSNLDDMDSYAIETGNFLYKQTLNTVDIHIFWFWLVWPLSGLSIFIHGIDNVITAIFSDKKRS
ncbi:TRAP transporter small permease subunit [Marinobacter salarius]|uniref:TRAP transporter small permease n=1 Tax=Marinobacter salarius TaxID=1420917 RepID=UPI00273AE90D|nr:TRAP transporter small permease subunit [Marinobacter salarius]MDP4533520.1 TRAP transporter small permease subunit [Marinobacter salarius]